MGFIGDILSSPFKAVGGLVGGGGGGDSSPLGGMFGGGGGGPMGMVGNLLGGVMGGGGGQQPQRQPTQGTAPQFPGYAQTAGPGAYPGWPVPGAPAQPTYNFQGDQSKPGAAENYFSQHQDKFGAPTNTQNYWNDTQATFGKPGQGDQFWNAAMGQFNAHKPTSNNAQGAYDSFKSSVPTDTSPYYDHALTTAENALKSQAASSGLLGSSGTVAKAGDIGANIAGQKALADANYGLQRAQLGGQLGGAADASSRGASADQLGWLSGLGSLGLGTQNADLQRLMGGGALAGNADQTGLASLMGGMGAATGAQNALRGRGQDYFNNMMNLGGAQSDIYGRGYGGLLGSDQANFDQLQQALLGWPTEADAQSKNGRASTEQGIGNLFGLFGSMLGGMGGM